MPRKKGMDEIVRDMEFEDLRSSAAEAISGCNDPSELYKVLTMLRADCIGMVDHSSRAYAVNLAYGITE